MLIPVLVEKYEDGYTIGATVDLTYVKPFNTIYDLENGWTIIDKGEGKYLEKTISYVQENLPDYVELHLVTTDKHKDGVEFRKFIDSTLGWIGPFPTIFLVYGDFSTIIFNIMGGIQTIFIILKKSKLEAKIMYFYEIHYVVIHQIKKTT